MLVVGDLSQFLALESQGTTGQAPRTTQSFGVGFAGLSFGCFKALHTSFDFSNLIEAVPRPT